MSSPVDLFSLAAIVFLNSLLYPNPRIVNENGIAMPSNHHPKTLLSSPKGFKCAMRMLRLAFEMGFEAFLFTLCDFTRVTVTTDERKQIWNDKIFNDRNS
jgi:hypothetical protein